MLDDIVTAPIEIACNVIQPRLNIELLSKEHLQRRQPELENTMTNRVLRETPGTITKSDAPVA